MLDNGSRDGSAQAAQRARDGRRGDRARRAPRQGGERLRAAAPRARALRAAAQRGLRAAAGRDAALWQALEARPQAALRRGEAAAPRRAPSSRRRGASRRRDGARRRAAAAPALTVQSRGGAGARGRLGPVGGAARPPRGGRAGRLPGRRLLRLLRRGRLRAAPARRRLAQLYVPDAVAIHHEQLSTAAVPERRIVEIARNRDRYMRKHHSPPAARAVRWLTAWTYALRALAALVLPGHDPRRYWRHVTRRCSGPTAARACARRPSGVQPRSAYAGL